MVGAKWTGLLVAALACGGYVLAQQGEPPSPEASGQVITVQPSGGPAQKCRVIKRWVQQDGLTAYEVESLTTGQRMTLVESSTPPPPRAPGTPPRGRMMQIFHWGRDNTPPPGSPLPPSGVPVNAPAVTRQDLPALDPTPAAQTRAGLPARPSRVAAPPVDGSAVPDLPPATKAKARQPQPAMQQVSTEGPALEAAAPSGGPVTTTANKTSGKTGQDGLATDGTEAARPATSSVTASVKPTPAVAPAPAAGPALPKSPSSPKAAPLTGPPSPEAIASGTDALPPGKDGLKKGPLSDWRRSWGKADNHQSRLPPKQNLPQADTSRPDPLQDVTTYAQVPGENKTADRVDAKLLKLNGSKGKAQPLEPAALAGAVVSPSTRTAAAAPGALAAGNVPPSITPAAAPGIPAGAAPSSNNPASAIPTTPPSQPIKADGQGGALAHLRTVFHRTPKQEKAQTANAFTADPTMAPTGPPAPSMGEYAMTPSLPKPVSPGLVLPSPATPGQQGSYAAYRDNTAAPQKAAPAADNPAAAAQASAGSAPSSTSENRTSFMPLRTAGPNDPRGAATPDQMLLDASGQNPQEMMLTMMHDALFPSHREWAAEKLAAGEGRCNPRVVDAMLQAARSDTAPTVRATCVRCLAKMQDPESLQQTLRALQADPDPQVRQEVEHALANVTPRPAAPETGPTLPVSTATPAEAK